MEVRCSKEDLLVEIKRVVTDIKAWALTLSLVFMDAIIFCASYSAINEQAIYLSNRPLYYTSVQKNLFTASSRGGATARIARSGTIASVSSSATSRTASARTR